MSGYIGRYINMFPDGSTALNTFGCQREGDMAPAIGGSLLLRRDEVLSAGNWDPSIFSNEEMELYSRLRSGERSIRYVDVPLVIHCTQKYDRVHTLLRLLAPSFGLGNKWYGIGQILSARMRKRDLYAYIRIEPYPFLYWGGISIGFVFWLAGSWILGASIAISTLTLISVKRGCKSLVIHSAQLLPALVGWTKYNPRYTPRVISAFRRSGSNLAISEVGSQKTTVF